MDVFRARLGKSENTTHLGQRQLSKKMQLKHTPLFVWQFSDHVLQQLFQFRLQAPNERIFLKTPARHAVQGFIGEIRDLQTMQPRNERAEFVQLHSQLVRQFRLVRDILAPRSRSLGRWKGSVVHRVC